MRVLQIHNMHLGEGKMCVSCTFWRGQNPYILCISKSIYIVHLADQNVRFTNPGCQSKNCHIKIRLRRSANLQKPLCVPLRVPGPTASSIRRSTTCTHFKKCFTHRERYIHTGRQPQIPALRGATRHANASGVARNPTQNAHFGGNWRKIGFSRASIIPACADAYYAFQDAYFGRC